MRNTNHHIVSAPFKTADGRKYVQLESGARRRVNDDGSLYERPGKAELKRRKRNRWRPTRRSAHHIKSSAPLT